MLTSAHSGAWQRYAVCTRVCQLHPQPVAAPASRAIPMIFRLFRRTPPDPSIAALYGAIVAQARAGAFYQHYRVPDTVDGRFEMIVLHLVLLLHRLDRDGEPARILGQGVFDQFCRDMDANLREMGVGDLSVPRRMRGVGEAFYGRRRVYAAALAGTDSPALSK